MNKLTRLIEKAAKREYRDDHLTTEERLVIVNLYKKENPTDVLPEDVDSAFVAILY